MDFSKIEKLRKIIVCYKRIDFSLRELRLSGNIYFSYTERLTLAKVEKVLLLQGNEKKVTLLLICHTFGFKENYSQELLLYINR